jgi:hypothetical protein
MGLVVVSRAGGIEQIARATWDPASVASALASQDVAALVAVLRAAFATARRDLGGGPLSIALMPAFAQVRTVELPPMRVDETRRVLARDAGRYFLDARCLQAIALGRLRRGAFPLAAATPDVLVDAVQRAAEAEGWGAEQVIPAPAAWAASGGKLKGERSVVVLEEGMVSVLRVDGGGLLAIRRVRGGAAERVADALKSAVGSARVAISIAGPAATAEATAQALHDHGITTPLTVIAVDDAATFAARYAADAHDLVLNSARSAQMRATSRRKATHALLAVAVVLTVIGGALQLWGAQRERDALRAERLRLKPRVVRALALRDSVQHHRAGADAIQTIAEMSPRWSLVIAHMAVMLPEDAHLTALRASGDTVVVEGAAASAAEVVQALRAAPGIRAVRPLTPFRQERAPDRETIERFALAIQLGATTEQMQKAAER